jgi:hypothetical protein
MRRIAIAVFAGLAAVGLASCAADHGRVVARPGLQRILDGDGIGDLKFGQSPSVVAAKLGRLFGPAVGARQIAHGYIRAGCGFYWEVWDGVGATSDGRLFVAQLTAWFRNSTFVGYGFGPNNFQTALSSWNEYATRPIRLATAKGLTVGDSLARGRRLYGRRYVLTTEMQGTPPNPRLLRLPVWSASTPNGRIEGGVGVIKLVQRAHGASTWTSRQRGIFGIAAGDDPNTPC